MEDHREVLALATLHTASVIQAVPDGAWDRLPGPGLWSLRAQLVHLALVRESILRTLAGEPTAGLGATFEATEWTVGGTEALAAAFGAHADRCSVLLERLRTPDLDRPFETPFGNASTPRNYLRALLLEETHHRAQMTLTLRLLGGTPPTHPGQAWLELGVEGPQPPR